MAAMPAARSSAGAGAGAGVGVRHTFTAGRPPWYDRHGEVREAFIIGVAGGSASGKTTVAQ
jgi:uridine kinase